MGKSPSERLSREKVSCVDAIGLSVFSSRIDAACEEMGAVLRHAAFSTNIKDRLDLSCAVFDPDGRLCTPAAPIPVHLGSMAISSKERLRYSVRRAFGSR